MAKFVVTIESPGAELSANEIEARLVAAIPKVDLKKNDQIHVSVTLTKPQFEWGTIGQVGGEGGGGGIGIHTQHHTMPEAWFTEMADELEEDVAFEDDDDLPEDFEEKDTMLAFEDDDEGFEGENATALDVDPKEIAIAPEQEVKKAIGKTWWDNYK